MRSQRPDNPFDAMRRVIEHEANQDDDNGFFAKLGDIEPDHAPTGHSLGLFQHWDTEREGPAFKWPPRDNGGKLPTGMSYVVNRNSFAYQLEPIIMPKKTVIDHLIDAFKAPFKPKRQPITKVRRVWRGPNPLTGRTFSTWYWQCALCDHNLRPREYGSTHYGELCLTWDQAQHRATRHAHNHH